MCLPKEYFLNKHHIGDMGKLNEELRFNIIHVEDIINYKYSAVEVLEQYKAYMDSVKAVRTSIELLYDLDFISHNYIINMENLNKDLQYSNMMKLNYEIKSILMHLEDTIQLKKTIEDLEEVVELLIHLRFILYKMLA